MYLTPHFLKQFDFDNISDRLYLRARLRFSSGLFGFQSRIYHNKFKDSQHYVSARCMVGCLAWHRKRAASNKPYPKFRRCTFFIQYKRPYCEHTGQRGNFKLIKFDMGHTHPLSLEWEKNDLDFDERDCGGDAVCID